MALTTRQVLGTIGDATPMRTNHATILPSGVLAMSKVASPVGFSF